MLRTCRQYQRRAAATPARGTTAVRSDLLEIAGDDLEVFRGQRPLKEQVGGAGGLERHGLLQLLIARRRVAMPLAIRRSDS